MLKTAKIESKSSWSFPWNSIRKLLINSKNSIDYKLAEICCDKFVVKCITYANEYLSIHLKIVKLGYLENIN